MFTPLAIPAWSTSTEASTVAVSGATNMLIPSPCTTTAGSTSSGYDEVPGLIRMSSSSPAAVTSGPTISGSRGPIRSASAPAGADSSSISPVTGSVARPAFSAL